MHDYCYRLGELRKDPLQRAKEALNRYYYEEWLQEPENQQQVAEALGF